MLKLTAENGKKDVNVQGHKFLDLPAPLEPNNPHREDSKIIPSGTFSPSLETENPFYWRLGNKEKLNNSPNHLCMSLRLIED